VAATCYSALDLVAAEAGRKGISELSASAESVDATRRAIQSLATVASPALHRDLTAFHARLEGRGAVTADEVLSD